MISFPHKTKQFGVFTIKLLIVIGAFYFIYSQISNKPELNWNDSKRFIIEKTSCFEFIIILLFSIGNRFVEIVKWKNLVSSISKISLIESTEQVLSALTLGVFTPYGIGEYAGKTLYYPKSNTKKIILLNLICNGIQMVAVVFFGIISFFLSGYVKWGLLLTFVILAIIICLYIVIRFKTKLNFIRTYIHSFSFIPNSIHRKNIYLGIIRYLILSHQFYFLFITFDIQIPYLTIISTISIIYLLANSLPSFQLFDFAIKGSVAVYFFGQLGINEWIVVFISTLMWVLNIVFPICIGSFFVIKFKSKW